MVLARETALLTWSLKGDWEREWAIKTWKISLLTNNSLWIAFLKHRSELWLRSLRAYQPSATESISSSNNLICNRNRSLKACFNNVNDKASWTFQVTYRKFFVRHVGYRHTLIMQKIYRIFILNWSGLLDQRRSQTWERLRLRENRKSES